MRDKEILGLYEAYMEVVENQQLDEGLKSIDTPEKAQGYAIRALGSATKAAFTGDKKTYEKRKKGLKMGQRKAERKAVEEQGEQVDLFDYILEHLVAEGYADTNEAALAIMANMSEEWKLSILDEEAPRRIAIEPSSPRLMPNAGPARVHDPKKRKKVVGK